MFEIRPYRKNETAAYYDPFRELEELERAFFGDLFEKPFPEPSHRFGRPVGERFRRDALGEFRADIRDLGDSYLLEADLPGFDKKDIALDLSGDVLTISAERKSEAKEGDGKGGYLRIERSYGKYSRSFDLSGVDAEGIRAKYENGVLALTLPKKQELLPEARKIEIE